MTAREEIDFLVGARVLIKKDAVAEKTEGGVYLAGETVKSLSARMDRGTVLAAGVARYLDKTTNSYDADKLSNLLKAHNPESLGSIYDVGDRVIFNTLEGVELDIPGCGVCYLVMDSAIAVVLKYVKPVEEPTPSPFDPSAADAPSSLCDADGSVDMDPPVAIPPNAPVNPPPAPSTERTPLTEDDRRNVFGLH